MDPYGDEKLVELYDADNAPGSDHAYFRAVADSLGAVKIIDLGCGTGLLTRALAVDGRSVVGIDPSPTMLNYARRTPSPVTWIDGDSSVIEPSGDVDLVVCSGNTLMHIPSLPSTFAAIAGALRTGGVLVFESRNPAARAWESWTREATYGDRDTAVGHLTEWLDLIEAGDDGRVVFDAHNLYDDGRDDVYRTELYFRSVAEITAALDAAGFMVQVMAGWKNEPFEPESRLMVFRAEKAGLCEGRRPAL
ncbi:class I SAM-dependent methyltransferase [Kribbella antibiotica]|uniref:Class I SAM-dependent methyltransferase n=1 Tax=Kribbella antibiotica TaxID=190195 RepID=A0A4R4Z951_9ACTN|nr:class I SAM-dependent methyltransferase [Kribbella antibiotica]TDD54496.1 class I SAM-dependent methyltransferase [Kribbella antibiotica]